MGLSRKKFAVFTIGFLMVGFCLGGIPVLIPGAEDLGNLIITIYGTAGLIYSVWAGWERLKNLQQSSWLILLMVVPYFNFGFLLYLLFAPEPRAKEESGSDAELMDTTSNFCPKCGTRRRDGKLFCAQCGYKYVLEAGVG